MQRTASSCHQKDRVNQGKDSGIWGVEASGQSCETTVSCHWPNWASCTLSSIGSFPRFSPKVPFGQEPWALIIHWIGTYYHTVGLFGFSLTGKKAFAREQLPFTPTEIKACFMIDAKILHWSVGCYRASAFSFISTSNFYDTYGSVTLLFQEEGCNISVIVERAFTRSELELDVFRPVFLKSCFLILPPHEEPVSGGLYGIDDAELMGAEDKLPLEDSPVISALDCPSLNNTTAFSLLADDSQTSASIFASPTSPPVLGESVLQGKRGSP